MFDPIIGNSLINPVVEDDDAMKLIASTVVSSDTASVEFTGLNSDNYAAFLLIGSLLNSGSSQERFYLLPNGETTLANYIVQRLQGSSGEASASTVQEPLLTVVAPNDGDDQQHSPFNIWLPRPDVEGFTAHGHVNEHTDVTFHRRRVEQISINRKEGVSGTITQITSLRIDSGTNGEIAAGSFFYLYGLALS